MTFPGWLVYLSWISIAVAVGCAVVVGIHVARHPQHMGVMNVVWPVTALYAGPMGLVAYLRVGRLSTEEAFGQAKRQRGQPPARTKPFWQTAGVGATHCGAGCSLGDLSAEWLLVLAPLTLFGSRIAAAWTVDFVLAFLFGIAFQYFAIAPMRHLSLGQGLAAAFRADALSLTATPRDCLCRSCPVG